MTTFTEGFNHYITRVGDTLFEDQDKFRFISVNVPNLHVNEDPLPHWHRVDEWEMKDAFKTLQQLGSRVTRCYTLSIRDGIRPGNGMAHIYGPGQYDETLFKDLDLVIALAHQYHIRLILPFIDHWDWFGGVKHFAAFRGKESHEFYTDPQIIADFKDVITYVMNRTNVYTGIPYKDDKAILAWETGNELDSPDSWISEIVQHIKSQQPCQLILDGNYGVSESSLNNPNIDIVSNHYYVDRGADFLARLTSDRTRSKGKKAFIVGEFGHEDPKVCEELLNETIHNGSTGAMLWSLRYHNKEGGFYFQGDPEDCNASHAYFWPESPLRSGGAAEIKMNTLRQCAYAIAGLPLPAVALPEAPILLPISTTNDIRWRGSVGATSYIIERSAMETGPWEIIASQVVEYTIPFIPYSDTPSPGQYYYRMRAVNTAGQSEPSNIESVLVLQSVSVT